jgi:hypothetical protein
MKQEFEYMLLNRLQLDCYLWLSGGGALWGIDPQTHADKMVELYTQLKIKPEWLTFKELKNLYYSLTKKELRICTL